MTERNILIPTQPGMGRSLINHDEASKLFPARALLKASQDEPRNRTWRRGRAYDQGMTSTCVAQTGKGILNTSPESSDVPYNERRNYDINEFYEGAQQHDEWPGEAYDGTSGLGLCRYLQRSGYITEYRWCFGLQDVLLTLSHVGPVGLGVWWYTGMFEPGERGIVEPTGAREGGHEVELIGVDVDDEEVIFMNSWGVEWGDRGRGRLKWTHLERLLNEQGDAFVIIE